MRHCDQQCNHRCRSTDYQYLGIYFSNTLAYVLCIRSWTIFNEKRAWKDANTARWLYSKAERKFFAPSQTPFSGAQDGQNLISWRWSLFTVTYRPSLVKSMCTQQTHKRTHKPTNKHNTHI